MPAKFAIIIGSPAMPATMNISLPEKQAEYVREQVSEGGYQTVSEYFRHLVREDEKRKARERLEVLLLEGLDSGPGTVMTENDWASLRGRIENYRKGAKE